MARTSPTTTFRTLWRLYSNPRRLAAALTKTHALLCRRGLRHVWHLARRKLHQPQFPIGVLAAQPQIANALSYQDRWVLVGHGLSYAHSVSIIISTKGNTKRVASFLQVISKSIFPDAQVEVLIVNNGPPLGDLPTVPCNVRVLDERRPFNWAAYNNRAADTCSSCYLLFLNDDVLPLHGGWLDALLHQALDPNIGAVGATLLYPTGQVQHLGISVQPNGECVHDFKYAFWDTLAPRQVDRFPRVVDAVTGACLLTPRRHFLAINGFDERFRENFNDVDLCLRLKKHGLLTVVAPQVELIHLESATRVLRVLPGERNLFRSLWLNL